MSEEFNEFYDMLSNSRSDVRKLKEEYEKELGALLGQVRSYQVGHVDITHEYDLENDFDNFKEEDIHIRFQLTMDSVEYKIKLLQGYLQELFKEKKFNVYKRDREQALTKEEYQRYIANPQEQAEMIANWYQDFMH